MIAAPAHMRALTFQPLVRGSARVEEIPVPAPEEGSILVQTMRVGVCGTDRELLAAEHGAPAPGRERMVLGHESLGRVLDAPTGSGFAVGDLVVGIVRRPDPVPCGCCAAGEWDMCENGLYTERGIRGLDGFASELFRIEPAFCVRVDPALGDLGVLLEPASVAAKAWEHIDRIGARSAFRPRRLLVTGAGPIGLFAALLGTQRGLEVHVFDRNETGPKPALVRGLGATHHGVLDAALAPDIAIECTGVSSIVLDTMGSTRANGITCLTGLSEPGRECAVDVGAFNRSMVLSNQVVLGAVNANRRHYEQAAVALARADRAWLAAMISRVEPLDHWEAALDHRKGDVKVVIELAR